MRRPAVALMTLSALALGGCTASTPVPAPSPSAVPLRTIAACGASVAVPPDAVAAIPKADAPPTVVVSVGSALSFVITRGARVGLVGAVDPGGDAELCAAAKVPAGMAELVALQPGYLRVGVQRGIEPLMLVLVRVSAA